MTERIVTGRQRVSSRGTPCIHRQEVLTQLRAETDSVPDADLVVLSPARFNHINRLDNYTLSKREALLRHGLRTWRQPRQVVAPTA